METKMFFCEQASRYTQRYQRMVQWSYVLIAFSMTISFVTATFFTGTAFADEQASITTSASDAEAMRAIVDSDLLEEEQRILARVRPHIGTKPTVKAAPKPVVTQKVSSKPPLKPTPVKAAKQIVSQGRFSNAAVTTPDIAKSQLPEIQKVVVQDIAAQDIAAQDIKVQDTAVKASPEIEAAHRATAHANTQIAALREELRQTRNQLIVAETEVDRLSKVLGERQDQKLARYVPAQALTKQTRFSRLTIEPSGAIPSAALSGERISSPIDMPIATVIADKAYLRTGAGPDNSPLMSVKRGTRLAVEVREGTWLRVTSPTGQRAWVSADVVELGSDPTPNASTFGARQRDFVSVRAVQRPTNGTATEMLPAKEQSSDEERAFQLLRRRGFSQ